MWALATTRVRRISGTSLRSNLRRPMDLFGGTLASSPDAASWAQTALNVFTRGTDNPVNASWNGNAWTRSLLPRLVEIITSDPGAFPGEPTAST